MNASHRFLFFRFISSVFFVDTTFTQAVAIGVRNAHISEGVCACCSYHYTSLISHESSHLAFSTPSMRVQCAGNSRMHRWQKKY